MILRGHNLLCIQGFVGKGYSSAFVANMRRIVEGLGEEEGVTIVAHPDAICSACPNLDEEGCRLHGAGTERAIAGQDRHVMARLGIREGETLRWGEIRARIAARVRPADLDSICGACPWLPLGVCKDGLARLSPPPR